MITMSHLVHGRLLLDGYHFPTSSKIPIFLMPTISHLVQGLLFLTTALFRVVLYLGLHLIQNYVAISPLDYSQPVFLYIIQ